MKVDIHDARAAGADREWLTNVYPFYLHDLSEFDDHYYTLTDRGLWEPDHLPSWLQDDTDHPLIITESRRRVGFALVNEEPSPHIMPGIRFRMSEFFILRKHRRSGVGRQAALALFDKFRGKWQLSILARNAAAIRFWHGVIRDHSGDVSREAMNSGEVVYVFDTTGGVSP